MSWEESRPEAVRAVLFCFLLLPTFFIGGVGAFVLHRDMTHAALTRRQAMVSTASAVLRERADHLIELGISLSTRVNFRRLVDAGQWRAAMDILREVPAHFPQIDRLFLAGLDGTEKADFPMDPQVQGVNFSHRDWYRGVSRGWKPYLSEGYLRAAEPRAYVVAAAIPVLNPAGRPCGILVLQVRLSTLADWLAPAQGGKEKSLVVVDRSGRRVSGEVPGEESLKDLSKAGPVAAAMAGKRGWEIISFEGRRELWIYEPVPGHGWSVLLRERVSSAFAARGQGLATWGLLCAVVLAVNAAGAAMLLALLGRLRKVGGTLEAANRELESFSYSVSHDLRAPLRSIDGFSQVLAEEAGGALSAEARDALARVRGGAQRMGQLIDDMLKLSRVTRAEMKPEDVDLADMARGVLVELSERASGRKVDWRVCAGAPARGDAHLLRIALQNLLENAWKYTSKTEGALIAFETEVRGGKRVYTVRDNGAGFDMAYADKLFVPFQRLHTEAEFPGTGIGLATVQRIIRRHGGRLWAEAAPGRGAAFHFVL